MAARRARRELRCVRARRRRRAVRRARRRRRAGRADARRVRPRRRPGVKREHLVAALALLALVAASLFANRPEPPAAATRASGDFSFGGYRAFSELLAREGIRVERFRRHHDALGESGIDTLVVAFPDEQLGHLWNAAERDALRAWVRRGGNLVDIGLTPTADKNDLKGERVVLAGAAAGERSALRGVWASMVTRLDDRGKNRLEPVKGAHAERLLGDAAGALVVRYSYGRGHVVGVANAALFENRSIARGDDARLAFLAARDRAVLEQRR